MKFDYIIGNPPYQDQSAGEKKADASIYHIFMESAFKFSRKTLLITPARFLFNNGNTPEKWNQKVLNDNHFKVEFYEPDSSKVFQNTDIKGGVAITYRDLEKSFEAIEHFTAYSELNSILKKVKKMEEKSITEIIYNQNAFNLNQLYSDYPELKTKISSEGKEKRLTSGCITYECFHDKKEHDDDVQVIGLTNSKRTIKYIRQKYLDINNSNFNNFKVVVPANNGSGAIGEVLSTPLIGEPLIGYTQTFIGFGSFANKTMAENAMKYIKTKFARALLGVLKVTQNGKKPMWKHVPLQDFTSESDIDWSKPIPEIDKQLYKKYDLSNEEIDFIERNVKEME